MCSLDSGCINSVMFRLLFLVLLCQVPPSESHFSKAMTLNSIGCNILDCIKSNKVAVSLCRRK